MMLIPWVVCILSIWTGPLLLTLFHSFACWWMAFAWCCWWGFSFCLSWFPCHSQQLFFPAWLSVSCCSSSSLPPGRSISSANRKLQSGHPPRDTVGSDMSTSSPSSSELSANWNTNKGSKLAPYWNRHIQPWQGWQYFGKTKRLVFLHRLNSTKHLPCRYCLPDVRAWLWLQNWRDKTQAFWKQLLQEDSWHIWHFI